MAMLRGCRSRMLAVVRMNADEMLDVVRAAAFKAIFDRGCEAADAARAALALRPLDNRPVRGRKFE